MSDQPQVDVAVAKPEERPILENLMQFYIHDFSEYWAGGPDGEIEADGRFSPYPLNSYWQDKARIPLLLRRDGNLIGFALVNDHSHTGRPVTRAMAEFFIARKHRRGGVGTAAARTIFVRYPGVWDVAVARRNLGALPFWRQAIRSCGGVGDIEEMDRSDERWNGTVFRFSIPPP